MLRKKKKELSPIEGAIYTVQFNIDKWNKRRKHWKRRFYIMVVFPVFLVALIIRAVKAYVRIKLWEMGTNAPSPFIKEEE